MKRDVALASQGQQEALHVPSFVDIALMPPSRIARGQCSRVGGQVPTRAISTAMSHVTAKFSSLKQGTLGLQREEHAETGARGVGVEETRQSGEAQSLDGEPTSSFR